MKTNKSKYYNLSNLKEIEYEKQFLQYKITKKEKMMERDWDAISDTWGFLSVAARGLSNIIEYIPAGVSAISSITNLFRGRSKRQRK
jgi:hypothetical protein